MPSLEKKIKNYSHFGTVVTSLQNSQKVNMQSKCNLSRTKLAYNREILNHILS